MERRVAIVICGRHAGLGVQQEADRVHVALVAGQLERCAAARLGVHLGNIIINSFIKLLNTGQEERNKNRTMRYERSNRSQAHS